MDMILTARELELLILIKSIWDYEAENPGNIPAGGIGEIAVSNLIYKPDEYEECLQKLNQFGFVDKKDKVTTAGNEYIEEFKSSLDEALAEENGDTLPKEKKNYFQELDQFLKSDLQKYPLINNVYIIVTIMAGIATIISMFKS